MTPSTVVPDSQPNINADQLEHTIAEKRRTLGDLATDHQRSRLSNALDHMAEYAVMLRESAAATPGDHSGFTEPGVGHTFKVEFDDGRWSIEEKELDRTPRVGDVVRFADGTPWRIRASQFVRPRPSGKPAREFFVCAPSV